MKAFIDTSYREHAAVMEALVAGSGPVIEAIADRLAAVFRGGGKLLLCGCGGSAADAQHIAGELVNRFRFDRGALPAIALTTDTSVLTCIANDSCFDQVFARQVQALARPGDALLAISTSGRSAVVLLALEAARAGGVATIGLTGSGGAATMGPLCDLLMVAPSGVTARVQECHEFAYHVICGLVESDMFPRQEA